VNPDLVREPGADEVDALARIWHDGWHEAHRDLLPAEVRRSRTLEGCRRRLQAAAPKVRVVGPAGAPVGFCMINEGEDEVCQLFVSPSSRGTGVAAALMADAEARLIEAGVHTARLSCAIGNDRAARFYEKCGWRRSGTTHYGSGASNIESRIDVWRYVKTLTR
jgi:GNAT superfamily N-acetyltransferase